MAIVVAFLFAEIYFEWGTGPLAAGVMGGMLAWYLTFVIERILWKRGFGPRFGIEGEPSISLLYRPPDAPPVQRKRSIEPADRP